MTTPPRSKIYTKRGDQGKTHLVNGECVEKFNPRVEAYGTIDELNAFLGDFLSTLNSTSPQIPIPDSLLSTLNSIQSELFNIGSLLACSDPQMIPRLPQIHSSSIENLEKLIDEMDEKLPPLKSFILPQGHPLSTKAHILRTVCRRAERRTNEIESQDAAYPQIQAYLNRLSDFFFVLSRWLNHVHHINDLPWRAQLK
jgi:cob(I)alamin adenosyltransferase